MIAHTLSKAIRDEKMQFPRLKENFCRYGVQKDVQHDGQMIDRRSALGNSGLPKMLEYA